MEASFINVVLLPVALGVIMLGLGLSLTVADFARVVQFPRAVIVAMTCQMLVLPVVCFGIAKASGLTPELAVGLMLLAASPGGVTANLYSHLAKGDVALNITLTAVNSVLTLFTLPLVVNLSLAHFMGEGMAIPLQFSKVAQIFAIILVPVSIGMAIRRRKPGVAERLNRPVKILSAVFLLLVTVAAVIKDFRLLPLYLPQVGLSTLAFNLASMALGYFVPLWARVGRERAIAIGMEIGIHNATLAIAVALSPFLLNNSLMAIPPAIYGLLMFITAAGFGFLVNLRHAPAPAAAAR